MAWVATENFDSYTTSADLSGGSGGSDWTNNWSVSSGGGTITVETAPAGGQGGKAARHNATAGVAYKRSVADVTVGAVSVEMRVTGTSPNDFSGILLALADGSGKMYVKCDAGKWKAFSNGVGGYVDVDNAAADTWQTIDIEFDQDNQANKYRVRVDGGTWTSWLTVNGGSYTSIGQFVLDGSASDITIYWDHIRETSAAPAGNPTIWRLKDGADTNGAIFEMRPAL